MLYFQLQIVEAHLLLPKRRKPPNACVRAYFDDLTPVRTKTIRKNFDPPWHEQLLLSAPTVSSVFHLRVFHHRTFLPSQRLCFVDTGLENLLKRRGPNEAEAIKLELTSATKGTDDGPAGFIILRIREKDSASEIHNLQAHPPDPIMAKNPVNSVIADVDFVQSFSVIMLKLDVFMKIAGSAAQIHPYINMAWQVTSAVYQIIKGQIDRDARVADLVSTMVDIYSFVDVVQAFPEKLEPLDDTIRKILAQTIECVMFIREYSGYGFGGRLLHSPWADARIDAFVQSFNSLKQSFNSGVVIQTAIVTFRIYDSMEQLVRAQNLSKLLPADMDDPSRTSCLPDTRIDVLNSIAEWATTPTPKHNVFWLHGLAGSGKSTISTTVANFFRELRRLGAFVFFNRDVTGRSDPGAVIRTLAYQLGEFDPRIGSAISKVIENTPSIRQSPIRWQFVKLLVEPLSSLKTLKQEGPIIIILDALDECGHPGTRSDLLKTLASEFNKLPNTIRILITSRAEMDISDTFKNQPDILSRKLDIYSRANGEDVVIYLKHQMAEIRLQNQYLSLPQDWPGTENILALASRASGLFIWASTACRFIESGQDPDERVAILIRSELFADAESALDDIYETALDAAGKWDDPTFTADFRDIIGLVVVAKNPLLPATIDLLNVDFTSTTKRRPALHTIQRLGCVLLWGKCDFIRIMHPSFADYLTDPKRSGRKVWCIDRPSQHRRVALQCLGRLRATLTRNMCNLTLSMDFVKEDLPDDVAYACTHWVDHVCEADGLASTMANDIESFLRSHFLHWIEAMALLKRSRQTIGLLIRLRGWMKINVVDRSSLFEFVSDTVRFCQGFTSTIEQHPLLVYATALPFTPIETALYKQFHENETYPQIAGGFRQGWSSILMEFPEQEGEITSLSYSPDGKHMISTAKNVIDVWDAMTGEKVIKPLNGHEGDVQMAVFSPSGLQIASCSQDCTVRVWNALSGVGMFEPLRGHRLPVCAVAFNPQGTLLLSGAKDSTIIAWDPHSGRIIYGPLEGHRKAVRCLAFSPDGLRFISGSNDTAVCVWDAANGTELFRLQQHSKAVLSVAFSPDGTRVLSGSNDKTLQLWDAQSGAALLQPLTGHNSTVYSVSFSPDGTQLISSSKDSTVRVWEAGSGQELSHLTRRHKHIVRCAAFSPDGTRVVSGAGDSVIRVWDAESVEGVGPLRLHKSSISAVAFSPDGKLLASGSLDKTIRLWDTNSGALVLGPLEGLEKEVRSVCFSSDGSAIVAFPYSRIHYARAWDIASGNILPEDSRHNLFVRTNSLSLEGQWIIDTLERTPLCMLPVMSATNAYASFKDYVVIGTVSGSVVIIKFPSSPTTVPV